MSSPADESKKASQSESVEVHEEDVKMSDVEAGKGGEAMDVESSMMSSMKIGRFNFNSPLARYQQLVSSEKVLKHSLLVLKFGIFADAMNSTILQPNYPIMVTPGADPDSFSSTSPFDFSTATYAMPMFALLGIAIAGLYSGRLSDKIGRKPVLLVSMFGSAIGSIAKWLLRNSFWGFCMASFGNGLVSGSLPVALAYVGDVFRTNEEKQYEFGLIVTCFVVGQSGGGIIAILMASTGLFAPLWVGAAMMCLAGTLMFYFLVEPGDIKVMTTDQAGVLSEEEEEDTGPKEIDRCCLWNIIIGALLDNIGSAGLFPLCLSPLMFDRFYADFEENPLLSLNGYKWLSVLVALVVIPTAMVTPWVYQKIGAAAACVMGNVCTGIVTVILLILGTVPTASTGVMVGFILVMYLGFPTTVFSQLSTSPMLDMISPREKRGYVQGLNSTFMNLGTAFAPWVLGIMADEAGTSAAIWCGFAISMCAAVVNAPLMCRPGFGPAPKKVEAGYKALPGEDKDVVEKALRGSFVAQDALQEINRKRQETGEQYLVMHVRPYEEDKQNMGTFRREALEAFRYQKSNTERSLAGIVKNPEDLPEICEKANKSLKVDPEVEDEIYKELGQWFADYLQDKGYFAYTNPIIMKQMIMSAFPVITEEKELSPENLEEILLNMRFIYSQYLKMKDDRKYSRTSILGTGTTTFFYG